MIFNALKKFRFRIIALLSKEKGDDNAWWMEQYINLIFIYFQPPAEGQVSAMSGILGKLPKWKNDSVSIARLASESAWIEIAG